MKRKPATSKTQSNGAIPIEKGIPLPTEKNPYPCAQMEVGDSFFVTGYKQSYVAARLSIYKLKTGHKYRTHNEPDGVRVWRIA